MKFHKFCSLARISLFQALKFKLQIFFENLIVGIRLFAGGDSSRIRIKLALCAKVVGSLQQQRIVWFCVKTNYQFNLMIIFLNIIFIS